MIKLSKYEGKTVLVQMKVPYFICGRDNEDEITILTQKVEGGIAPFQSMFLTGKIVAQDGVTKIHLKNEAGKSFVFIEINEEDVAYVSELGERIGRVLKIVTP